MNPLFIVLNLLSGIDPNIGKIVSDNVIIVKYLIKHQEMLMKQLGHESLYKFQGLFLLSVTILTWTLIIFKPFSINKILTFFSAVFCSFKCGG